jgi:26S proteasome regulatory subunit T6
LREELQLLQEPGSYVGEVLKVRQFIPGHTYLACHRFCFRYSSGNKAPENTECSQVMGKNKVLVKVHPEGKYVVDLDKSIDIAQVLGTDRKRSLW